MLKVFEITLSLLVGFGLSLVGFVNLFWGNDPFFGFAIVVSASPFYWPVFQHIQAVIQPKYWRLGLAMLAVLIVWAALGVGELGDKIALMRAFFPMPKITGI